MKWFSLKCKSQMTLFLSLSGGRPKRTNRVRVEALDELFDAHLRMTYCWSRLPIAHSARDLWLGSGRSESRGLEEWGKCSVNIRNLQANFKAKLKLSAFSLPSFFAVIVDIPQSWKVHLQPPMFKKQPGRRIAEENWWKQRERKVTLLAGLSGKHSSRGMAGWVRWIRRVRPPIS